MLNDLITSLEEEKAKAREEHLHLEKTKEEARERLKIIREKREEYLRKWEDKCREKLLELDVEIDDIKKEVAKKERRSITKSKEKVRSLKERLGGPAKEVREDIRIGDYVLVKTLGSKGYVVDVDREGSVSKSLSEMKNETEKVFLIESVEGQAGIERQDRNQRRKNRTTGLNLVGMRVEEALKVVDTFLDRAVVEGVSQIRIVHGIGTGRLMQAVRGRLGDTPYVREYHPDERNAGVTIVEFA